MDGFPLASDLQLVGGLEHVYFFHILGIITPTDFHVFQRGWNHQPDNLQTRYSVEWSSDHCDCCISRMAKNQLSTDWRLSCYLSYLFVLLHIRNGKKVPHFVSSSIIISRFWCKVWVPFLEKPINDTTEFVSFCRSTAQVFFSLTPGIQWLHWRLPTPVICEWITQQITGKYRRFCTKRRWFSRETKGWNHVILFIGWKSSIAVMYTMCSIVKSISHCYSYDWFKFTSDVLKLLCVMILTAPCFIWLRLHFSLHTIILLYIYIHFIYTKLSPSGSFRGGSSSVVSKKTQQDLWSPSCKML